MCVRLDESPATRRYGGKKKPGRTRFMKRKPQKRPACAVRGK